MSCIGGNELDIEAQYRAKETYQGSSDHKRIPKRLLITTEYWGCEQQSLSGAKCVLVAHILEMHLYYCF